MTRDQKEKYVLELYQQGKTFREIAGLSHTSFSQIDKIIKRYKRKLMDKITHYVILILDPSRKNQKPLNYFQTASRL